MFRKFRISILKNFRIISTWLFALWRVLSSFYLYQVDVIYLLKKKTLLPILLSFYIKTNSFLIRENFVAFPCKRNEPMRFIKFGIEKFFFISSLIVADTSCSRMPAYKLLPPHLARRASNRTVELCWCFGQLCNDYPSAESAGFAKQPSLSSCIFVLAFVVLIFYGKCWYDRFLYWQCRMKKPAHFTKFKW